jgi:hypothetical protein
MCQQVGCLKEKLQAAYDTPGLTCVITPVVLPEDRAALPQAPAHITHVEAATITDALLKVFPDKGTQIRHPFHGYTRDGLLALCEGP